MTSPGHLPKARTLADLSPRVREFISKPRPMLIDGQWVQAASGKTFETFNPSDGTLITRVAEGDAEDIDRAVLAAERAFKNGPWSKMSASDRAKIIWKIADLMLANLDELAELESLDNGKPVTIAKLADVPASAEIFHYMSGWATKIEGSTVPLSFGLAPGTSFHAYTRKEPLGVVGQIIPWNFPLLMAAFKLGPALATGNCVVLKPAEETPLSVLRLGELMLEAGLPPGVVNIVPGFGETAGAALAKHPRIKKVAFTGSTEVGKMIVRAVTPDLKKVTLELGGKSPNIICDDADLDLAIPGAASAIFFNQGQCCTAGSRLFVQEKVFDRVVEGISAAASAIRLGPGLDPTSEMGPLISERQLHRVSGFVAGGLRAGAKAATGGKPVGTCGYFMQPTVLVDVTPTMEVFREEIFGPVVTVSPFKAVDDLLVAQVNDSIYGLAAGVWTRDISRSHYLTSRLEAGTVWVNCYNVLDPAMPFGGYKQSGWGREHGRAVLEHYTETKSVCVAYPSH